MQNTGEHHPVTARLRRAAEWLPIVSLPRLWDSIRSRFWIVPAAAVAASIGLAVGLVALDHGLVQVHSFFVYPGPPSGARSFLSSIVTAMIAVTGTVFSVSVLVLQLANTQFSSRAIRMYLRDLTVQATLGLFMATFVYAMVVQRSVVGGPRGVPRIAVSVAFLFMLASVAMFIRYVSHISDMIRVASIVRNVADESRRVLEKRYPADGGPAAPARPDLPPEAGLVVAPGPGVVVSVNEHRLVEIATEHDCVLAVTVRVGDFLPAGAPLCRVHRRGQPARPDEEREVHDKVVRAVAQDAERTMEQDLAFGFRQLIDIAEKALSPALNDPTTASQCLDALHDLLRRLAGRRLPDGVWYDGGGAPRLTLPQYSFTDFLRTALTEIWLYGRNGAQVHDRIMSMLSDLAGVAVPEHRAAVADWQARIEATTPAAPD